MWIRFQNRHVGGLPRDYELVYARMPYKLAIAAFQDVLGFDPQTSSCHCCGQDYDVETLPTLIDLMAWLALDGNVPFDKVLTLTLSPDGEYVQSKGFPELTEN